MPTNNEITIRGGYVPFGLTKDYHLDIFGNAVDKITQQHEKALERRSSIISALANLELNEAEDEWKTNYLNDIQNKIDTAAEFGNYASALTTAVKLAGDALSNPALLGRVRAQKEYKTFVDNTLARKDLTEDDKSWALAMNPYKYEDKYDNRGNIVGGTNWKPNIRPVGEIDYNRLLATAKQLVFQESGGATNVVFYDSEGRDTKNPLAAAGVKYYKNGKWEGISKKKLTDLLEAAIDNEPGARARLDQDWTVANWKYDQLSNEEKLTNKPSELFASNGRRYSKQEWYNNKFGRAINSMAGMNYTSSIKYDDDYNRFMAARAMGTLGGGTEDNRGLVDITTGLGTPAQIETENVVNKAFGKVTSGVQDIENLIPAHIKNLIQWKKARKNGDYNTLAKLADMYVSTHDIENKAAVKAKIRDLKDNASLVTSIKRNNGDYESLSFNGALTTGGELPADNKYTSTWNNLYDQLGGTKLRYAFANDEERNNFMERLGLSNEKYSNLKGNDSKGYPTITIDKSNPINNKAIVEYFNGNYGNLGFWGTIFSPSLVRFVGVDDNGVAQPVKSIKIHGAQNKLSYDILMRRLSQVYDNASRKASKSSKSLASNVMTVTTKHMPLPGVMEAMQQYKGEPSKIKAASDLAVTQAINAIQGMNGSQYEIYMFDPKTNTLSKSNISDRTEALSNIQSYIAQNSANAENYLGTRLIDGKAGYRITVPKQWSKAKNDFVDGTIGQTELVIFNVDDPTLNRLQRDTRYQAAVKYDRLARINNASHTTFDNVTVKFENSNPYVNGRNVTREQAIAYLDRDQAYNDLKDDIKVNRDGSVSLTPNFDIALCSAIRDYYGYPIGSGANKEKAQLWLNQMINELK